MAEDIEKQVTNIRTDLDKSLNLVAQSLASLDRTLAEQEVGIYELRAVQTQHSRDIRDIKIDIKALQVNVSSMREETKASLEQIIAILNERMPKQTE